MVPAGLGLPPARGGGFGAPSRGLRRGGGLVLPVVRVGSPGEGFEEAAGVGDAGWGAGGLGGEGGEGGGEGAGQLRGAGAAGQDGRPGAVAAVGSEWGLTLNRKEQERPQGPEVGRRAGRVASDLLGGEERGRGLVGAGGEAGGGRAEAGQTDPAVGGDQDVRGAEVEGGRTGG